MLQEKYMPAYDVRKAVNIIIDVDPPVVFSAMSHLQLHWSWITTLAYRIRGMKPPQFFGWKQLKKSRFTMLEVEREKEIILGIIGSFWTTTVDVKTFQPEEFVTLSFTGCAKATWNFELRQISENKTLLRTETRVLCPGRVAKIKFCFYWFIIQPFSTLIRKEILESIKMQAEGSRRLKSTYSANIH